MEIINSVIPGLNLWQTRRLNRLASGSKPCVVYGDRPLIDKGFIHVIHDCSTVGAPQHKIVITALGRSAIAKLEGK